MVVFWVKMGNWKRNQRRNYSYESPRSHHTGPAPRPPPHPAEKNSIAMSFVADIALKDQDQDHVNQTPNQ